MNVPTAVVSEQEWNTKREAPLVKEKELTRARDALSAQRRRLPMVRVENDYRFEGPEGFVSAGSQDAIRRYRKRMGWDVPWYTTLDDFSADLDVPEYWGVNVFLRDGEQIYRSYFASGRAAEDLSSVWGLLDITPFGRQEEWQDAPDGVPQDPGGSWTRRHDEYGPDELAGGRTSA
jgi:predicted dithiol-disulfide oxidoreductase (DUF899 family)